MRLIFTSVEKKNYLIWKGEGSDHLRKDKGKERKERSKMLLGSGIPSVDWALVILTSFQNDLAIIIIPVSRFWRDIWYFPHIELKSIKRLFKCILFTLKVLMGKGGFENSVKRLILQIFIFRKWFFGWIIYACIINLQSLYRSTELNKSVYEFKSSEQNCEILTFFADSI